MRKKHSEAPIRRLGVIALLFFICGAAAAADQGLKTVAAAELRKMIDEDREMLIVDARTEQEYQQGHIPSAVNITPEKQLSIRAFLPADKQKLLIFYCRGTG
jgi:3-mercaptopyruvate sulfurtransferase SseA